MKNLLKKEFKFASILSYLFVAFSAMALIPNYPILVGAFFVCFGIFHTFQASREANDLAFCTMLPVKKCDIVKSKYLFVVSIEAAAFAAMLVFVALRLFVLNKYVPFGTTTLLNANLTFLGFVLLVFACFNIIFVGGYFKTAYKIGIPFLLFAIASLVLVATSEALHFLPKLFVLNANFHYLQLIVFGIGAATYFVGTYLSLKQSQKRFNNIDL